MAMLRGSFRPGKVKDVAHFIPSLYFISSTAAVHAGEPAKPVEPARIAKPTSRFKAGADKPPPPLSADEYNLKKAVYSKEMRALRSKLYKELQVQRLHDIKAEREEAVSVEVGRQRKKEAAQAKKGQGRGARDQAAAELREVVAAKREESGKRQALREQLLADARAERKEVLMNQSKFWILPENLDDRIDYALRMPESLPYNG